MAGGAGPSVTAQIALQARPATLALKPGQPPTPIWELAAVSHTRGVHLKRGDRCEVVFRNDLPVPLAPVWYGLNGPAAADPLRGRAPTAPDATETSIISIPNAGTLLTDFRLFEDGLKQPARPLPIIAEETSRIAVDRDEVLLIEEWRLRPDGTALPRAAPPRTRPRSIQSTGRLHASSQPPPMSGCGCALSMAPNALSSQSNWRITRSA
ncbi:hypothetical protein NK6_9673 [Bradyrhizobium diazoefficiens]|uniref:Multicopper oxidase n=1 Tax=Bradyrhizobium diazoefficiens TaxID=1355477 RepID=A0A0E4FYL5_9BRAD|nr:hypothetical protein NK6_9673 [Bradyrhizobium diazoefficiens]